MPEDCGETASHSHLPTWQGMQWASHPTHAWNSELQLLCMQPTLQEIHSVDIRAQRGLRGSQETNPISRAFSSSLPKEQRAVSPEPGCASGPASWLNDLCYFLHLRGSLCLLSQDAQFHRWGKEQSSVVSLNERLVEYSHLKLFLHFQAWLDQKFQSCKPKWLKKTELPQKSIF